MIRSLPRRTIHGAPIEARGITPADTSHADDGLAAAENLALDQTLLPPGERVLVAVSGGGDSMALLLALLAARRKCGLSLVAAHINHELRGRESDEDERFVVTHCQRLGVPIVVARAPLKQRNEPQAEPETHQQADDSTRAKRPPSEAAARVARYAALLRLARDNDCRFIATGHTASDTLETFFINLLRGAAVEGLGGIKPQRVLAEGVMVVRPLWQATRDEARRACREAGWRWREDSSNQSAHHLRNRVRRELLPLLGELTGELSAASRAAPDARSANVDANGSSAATTASATNESNAGVGRLTHQVARAAALWRDDIEWMDDAAQRHLAAMTLPNTRGGCDARAVLALDGGAFVALPVALQRRVLRAAVRQVKGDLLDIGAEPVERARRHIAANGRRAVWPWRGGLRVEWTGAMAGNRIRLWLVEDAEPDGKPNPQPQTVAPPQ